MPLTGYSPMMLCEFSISFRGFEIAQVNIAGHLLTSAYANVASRDTSNSI